MKQNKRFSMRSTLALLCAVACLITGIAIGSTFKPNTALAESANDTTTQPNAYQNPAVAVAQQNVNAVVGVITLNEQWNRASREVESTEISEGSGVIISKEGHIITNHHVISNGTSFQVLLYDGTTLDAELRGSDEGTDLAVLQIDPSKVENMTVATLGSSENLTVGETVIAIGNPSGTRLAGTVTQGIVSALEREVNDAFSQRSVKTIQHDAAINSGNSGGGLFNAKGELIGINTLKVSGMTYSGSIYEGLGFAIPVNTAMPIVNQIIEHGKVRRAALGIMGTAITEGADKAMINYPPKSVMVADIPKDSPAEAAGIKVGDFIIGINEVPVTDMLSLTSELDKHQEGDTVKITLVRYSDPETIYNIYRGTMQGNNAYGYGYGYDNPFGNDGYDNYSSDFETIEVEVTLKVMD